MSAPFFAPFNFQPVSTTVSSSLTLAAGRYAYVYPLQSSCTVDGTEMHNFLSYSSPVSSTPKIVTIDPRFSGRFVTGAQSDTKTLSFASGANKQQIAQTTATTILSIYFNNGNPSGGTIGTAVSNGTGNIIFECISGTSYELYTFTPFGIWVPSLTVLAGGRWLITQYNQIT